MATPPAQPGVLAPARCLRRLACRLRERDGQGMVEYAFILMMVAIALILIVAVIGNQTSNMYSNISNGFTGH